MPPAQTPDPINTSAALNLLVGDIPAVTALLSFLEKHRETMDSEVRKGFDSLWLMLCRKALVTTKVLTEAEANWMPPAPLPPHPEVK